MFVEVLMYDYILRRWRENPAAPKRSYEAVSAWQGPNPENDRALSRSEVEELKARLKTYAPTTFYLIFPEDRAEVE